jgi:hypothetical protein
MTLALGGLAFLLWLAVIPAPKTASTERDGVPDERARGDSS